MGYTRPLLISASMDTTIRLWDVATQKQIEALQYKESQVNCMCITPDGAQFLIGAWQNLRIYDMSCLTATGLHNSTVHEKNVTSVGFQTDGTWMYTGGEDCMAKIWDMRINQLNCQRIFQVNTPIHSVALHPNQVELFIADSTGAIYLWDLRSDRDDSLITEVDLTEYVVHIDIDRLGRQCAAVTNRGNLFFWDISQPKEAAAALQPTSSQSHRSAAGDLGEDDDNFCSPIVPEGLPPIAPPPSADVPMLPTNPMMLPNMQHVEGHETAGIYHQGVGEGRPMTRPTPNGLNCAKYSAKMRAHMTFALKCRYRPDGLAIATTSADHTTKLWSVTDQTLLDTYTVPGNKWVWDCAFTNDSAHMLTASSDGILRMWDLASKSVVRIYQGHSMGITAFAFKDCCPP